MPGIGQHVQVLNISGKIEGEGIVAAVGLLDRCPRRDQLVKVNPRTHKEEWIWPKGRSLEGVEVHLLRDAKGLPSRRIIDVELWEAGLRLVPVK